jgi:hypothetical protein
MSLEPDRTEVQRLRRLLGRYAAAVRHAEGVLFADCPWNGFRRGKLHFLSKDEQAEIRALSKEEWQP